MQGATAVPTHAAGTSTDTIECAASRHCRPGQPILAALRTFATGRSEAAPATGFSGQPGDSAGSASRLAILSLAAAATVSLLTVYSWFIPEPGPNELSRIDLAFALAREHRTTIDSYFHNTVDRALVGQHYFSDKPPGLAMLAAPILWLLDRGGLLGAFGAVRLSYVAHLLTVVVVSLPAALMVPLLATLAIDLGAGRARALGAAVVMALSTALLPFATVFFAHATAAFFALAAFALTAGSLGQRRPLAASAAAGLAAGLATLVEYPVALVGAILLVWRLARRDRPGALGSFAVGGAVGLAPAIWYNTVSFGAPWRLGYGFVDQRAFGGMLSGFFGITRPSLDALAEILVGPAGLLYQSPFLLLAPLGLVLWYRRAAPAATVAVAIGLAFVAYNASYYLPMGGQSSGPRFLVPAIPFLVIGLAFLPRLAWLAVLPLAAWSAVTLIAIVAVEPKIGPGQTDPFLAYWWPRLRAGDVALSWAELRLGLHGLVALVPMALPLAIGAASAGGVLAAPRWRGAIGGLTLTTAIAVWLVAVNPLTRGGVPPDFQIVVADAPRQVEALFDGELELLGYAVPGEARPGDIVPIEIFWQAHAPLRENLIAFVHAIGRDGQHLGGYDGPPVGGGFPTNLWRPGEIVRAPYRIRIDRAATVPTAMRFAVGLRGPGEMGVIPARDAAGRPIDGAPTLGPIPLRWPIEPSASTPSAVHFERGPELIGWELPAASRPGQRVHGTLTWRATAPIGRDLTVFVQMLGAERPVAQWDAPPLGGSYPTSMWRPGEVITDRFELAIPADLAPGQYPVIAGLYTQPDIRRLAVDGADHAALGSMRVSG